MGDKRNIIASFIPQPDGIEPALPGSFAMPMGVK